MKWCEPYLAVMGWSGGAKVSCILRQRSVQLILAYSWARPAILVAGKGRWGIFLFLLFLHFHSCSFLPCPSLSSLQLSLLSLFSLSLGDDTKWPTRVDVSLNPNTINMIIGWLSTQFVCNQWPFCLVAMATLNKKKKMNFLNDISSRTSEAVWLKFCT